MANLVHCMLCRFSHKNVYNFLKKQIFFFNSCKNTDFIIQKKQKEKTETKSWSFAVSISFQFGPPVQKCFMQESMFLGLFQNFTVFFTYIKLVVLEALEYF